MNYNTNFTVDYNNDNQYRKCLRIVFNMDLTTSSNYIKYLEKMNDETFDEETEDEMLFDNDSVVKGLSFIYDKTSSCACFLIVFSQHCYIFFR